MSRRPTYAQLISLLLRLGFRDVSRDQVERAFHHQGTDTLVAFSMMHKADDDPVTSGDWLSAKTNLEANGLVDGPLDQRIEENRTAESPDVDDSSIH
jgi:hypothetical protein